MTDRLEDRMPENFGSSEEKAVLCAGEILVDIISKEPGKGLESSVLFERRPGGSPFNVAIGTRRLGVQTAFLSKLGGDHFAHSLLEYLQSNSIMTEYVAMSPSHKTTLAFAAIDEKGKPEFTFYRDNAADVSLSEHEVENIEPENFLLFHFGSIALLHEPAASAYMRVFDSFCSAGVVTTFDPNIRPSLVSDKPAFLRLLHRIIPSCDVVKLSDDDLSFIAENPERSIEQMARELPVKDDALLIITLGNKGAGVLRRRKWVVVPGFNVKVEETTGCGDAFMAGIISQAVKRDMDLSDVESMVAYANACAAIVATRIGAANAMPEEDEVALFIDKHRY